jgi:radical SAM superfamily enzyme YgiQ (UPF0313 family)
MKLLLISPCKDPSFRRSKFVLIPQLALHVIAGLTPEEHEVKIVEEEIEDINIDEECDLVGLTCMTANAPRAYHLAHQFRKRGKKVVLGGIHPTILPDEALQHADSVVIGEVEGVWRQLLDDFAAGKLRERYHKAYPVLNEFIDLRTRIQTRKRLFDVVPVMTTRGCPWGCDFCCVHDIYGRKIRHIPVENVVRDIVSSGRKFFLFLDDNIVGDPVYAKNLFKAIKPLSIKWTGQASISFVSNTELLDLAAGSGCTAMFFGLESVSKSQLKKMRKSIKDLQKLEDAIRRVKDAGIYFHASMIFGFDDDTVDVFPETLTFLEKNRISSASLNVLTPYPGTKIYRQFLQEDRLLTNDWKYFDHNTVVYQPVKMTPFELQAGRMWIASEFTKLSSIARKLPYHLDHPLYHLAMNLGIRRIIGTEMRSLPKTASTIFPVTDFSRRPYLHHPFGALKLHDLRPGRCSSGVQLLRK